MRKILFRAKLKDWKTNPEHNKWVEGFYLSRQETTYCFKEDYEKFPVKTLHYIAEECMTDWGLPNSFRSYEIDPDTLCQYTGVTTDNGQKIYENDIIRTQEYTDRPYSDKKKSKRHVGVVEYHIGQGDGFYNEETEKWNRHREYSAEWRVKIKNYDKYRCHGWGYFFDCEVIGNIFDNAELLDTE